MSEVSEPSERALLSDKEGLPGLDVGGLHILGEYGKPKVLLPALRLLQSGRV